MAIIKFKIDYSLVNKELVDRTEKTLINEGWKKTNYTYPSGLNEIDPNQIYTSWFEREFK